MAAKRFTTRNAAVIATGTSAKTILQIKAASGHAAKISEISFSFGGISTTGPQVLCEVMQGVSDDGASSAGTVVTFDRTQSGSATVTSKENYTSEPGTPGDAVFGELVHPQAGYTWRPPGGLTLKDGESIGLRVTTSTSVNVMGRFIWEE